MSNYPEGAEFDSRAPYNVEEVKFKFEINLKGMYYYEGNPPIDTDEAEEVVRKALEDFITARDGNIEIKHSDISIF